MHLQSFRMPYTQSSFPKFACGCENIGQMTDSFQMWFLQIFGGFFESGTAVSR